MYSKMPTEFFGGSLDCLLLERCAVEENIEVALLTKTKTKRGGINAISKPYTKQYL